MKNIPLLIGTILGTLGLIVLIAVMFSRSDPNSSSTEALTVDPALVAGEKRLAKGPAEARVTVVEFSDFQCPACKAVQPLVQQLTQTYPDQVQVVYRHFPLDSIHPNARLAAVATEVAQDYGKFWEMHDLLFARQGDWDTITSRDQLKETFANYAQELEIDKSEFLTKIEDNAYAERVQADASLAGELNLQSTPTFFVNGVMTPAPQLSSAVQSVLATPAQ